MVGPIAPIGGIGALAKVQVGQPLRIPASAYNAFVDAANYANGQQFRQGPGAVDLDIPGTIMVYNGEDITIPQYGVIWLTGRKIHDVSLGVRPQHPFLESLAIAASPIASRGIGRAWPDGIHPVLCYDVEHLYYPCRAITQSNVFSVRRHGGGNIRLVAAVAGASMAVAVLGRE